MPDVTLSQAWKEACASAPSNQVMLHTLEFRHPSFVDQNGAQTSIRVVLDYVDLSAQLEASAPLNPSTYVNFTAFNFKLTLPESRISTGAQLVITLDNVSEDIETNLAAATQSPYKVQVTYRAFLSTDLTTPQNIPPLTMTLVSATTNNFTITMNATFSDPANLKFPTQVYNTTTFPGLA